ncbi:hypothetical protein ROZALSC1DRAFT_11414, partial [Rozella allomycis CSF55]
MGVKYRNCVYVLKSFQRSFLSVCQCILFVLQETVCLYLSLPTWKVTNVTVFSIDANNILPGEFDIGSMNGQLLVTLEQMINEVYLPMLNNIGTGEHDNFRNEVRLTLNKFATQIGHTVQQVAGDVRIRIPNIDISHQDAILKDNAKLEELDKVADEWVKIIASILDKETKKVPQGHGPIAEIDYWRERNGNLSTLYEQLSLPVAKSIIHIVQQAETVHHGPLTTQLAELQKLYTEARDNTKFLGTLERHFKSIITGSLQGVQDSLPSLMNAIKMVWILSRHYNRDERMVPLMVRIAWEISNKVMGIVNVREILREPTKKAKKTISDAKNLLEAWSRTYFEVRDKIEQSGRDQRWEFDRRKLFEQTNYMTQRCADLFEVVEVMEQFYSIFGPELKAVTGDPQQIDEVIKRIEGLIIPIESITFDLFNKKHQPQWDIVMTKFREQILQIEDMAKQFIDASFKKLRSAEGAFDLLLNIKNIKSRESINKQLLQKFNDILEQYSKEIDIINEIFVKSKDDPPVNKNEPKIAGSISWSRSLFQRIKKTILRFQSMKEMLDSDMGKQVTAKYLTVAKSMKEYEDQLYRQWCDHVESNSLGYLKAFILAKEAVDGSKEEIFVVNYKPELKDIVREAKYLDRMNFTIPSSALNIALQEEKYHSYVEQLSMMLKSYNEQLNMLDSAEKKLLVEQIQGLKRVLKPGLTRLNWNSLGITDFLQRANQEISKFAALVNQVHKNATNIAHAVDSIAKATLLKEPSLKDEELMDAQEFFESMNKSKNVIVDGLVQKYTSITPLMIKMESMVANTNTGRSPQLRNYYAHWEKKIFVALNQMVITSLYQLASMFSLTLMKKAGSVVVKKKLKMRHEPLFKVSASLSAPEIVLSPNMIDIQKMTIKFVRSVVEATKKFVRWQNGTCILTPPQKIVDEEEPFIFSYYSDVVANANIVAIMVQINQALTRTFNGLVKYLDSWRRYRPLWKVDKTITLEKFAQKKPSFISYDEKLVFYFKLAKDVETQITFKKIDFIKVISSPLQSAIYNEAQSWIASIGKLLNDSVLQDLNAMEDKYAKFHEELSKTPETLEQLTFILSVISQVREIGEEMEIKYRDIIESYRTLIIYDIKVEEDQVERANGLVEGWNEVTEKAKGLDRSLIPIKKKFTEATIRQVNELKMEIKTFLDDFIKHGPRMQDKDLDLGTTQLSTAKEMIVKFQQRRENLVSAEKLFNLDVSTFSDLYDLENEMILLSGIYELYNDVKKAVMGWSKSLWSLIDISSMNKTIETFVLRLKKLPKEIKQMGPFNIVAANINSFKDSIPLYSDLKNEALRERHWKKLMEITGKQFDMNPETFTLEKLFSMNLHEHSESIGEIVGAANKELSIENGLKEVEVTWKNIKFTLVKYTKGNDDRGFILGAIDEIITLLDDNAMNLQSMSASKFAIPFLPIVQKWEKILSHIGEVTDVWMVVQRKWMYLESIFIGSGDIRQQLPEEALKFDKIDKSFKKIMSDTAKNNNVLDACNSDNRLQVLQELSEQLESCQKSLSDYLESKRNAFPRFFFISDDELLSILGSHDPKSIQEHIIKMFDNVLKLQFGTGRNEKNVVGMQSTEGEVLEFVQPVPAVGRVEEWMTSVQNEMKRTNRLIHKEAIYYYVTMDRKDWLYKYQGMVGLAGSQVWWTFGVEDSFDKIKSGDKLAMKKYSKLLQSQLEDLVVQVRSDLNSNDRRKINTQIIVDVHARDIIDKFVRDSVIDSQDFQWSSQLRFYWDKNIDDILVKQCNGVFDYGHEYMGLNGRLVITPLTDRCYLTLTLAISLKLGGSPAGPAGTGKTETVKDLAKAMGCLCIVTNCGEGLDFKAMGKIFSGLCQTGAWGCFDEFNRIELAVLSVIQAQVKTIQNALSLGLKRFQFEGNEIALDKKVTLHITMNPGYAGRTELPDNLKALFRPVVMVVPDLELICEIMLFSEGFTMAKLLAKKMVVLYKLAKGQLSRQHHYDFGLRALKSVLVMAGQLKRSSPDLNEDVVLMRALRDMNLPKFIFDDVPLFLGLISDLFPGLDCPRVRYPSFNDAVEECLREGDYIIVPEQVDKVIQLYETMMTRHTTMVVGPTQGGKSVVIETLAKAQSKLGLATKLYTLNAKAVSVHELYGILDPNTRDWTDGLLSNIFRECNKPTDKKERKYILFDGDVDAVWVENMNSVMDDNKILTLPNGERIRLQKHVSLLFEVEILSKYFVKYVPMAIEFITEGVFEGFVGKPPKTIVNVSTCNYIFQLCNLLESVLNVNVNFTPEMIEAVFIECIVWSIGGVLIEQDRERFDNVIKKLSEMTLITTLAQPITVGELPGGDRTIYDYHFDVNECKWQSWNTYVPEYKHDRSLKWHEILVPTMDVMRHCWLLEKTVSNKKPALFIGGVGCCKTVTVQHYLRNLSDEKNILLNMNFSSRTSSMDVQVNLEANVEKRTKDTYGPTAGKRLIVFVDDLNMPQKDIYGTQQPIALLKLLIEKGGLYDRGKELNWKYLKDVQFLAAMGPPGGGRSQVDSRFMSLFNIFNISFPKDLSLQKIFTSILNGHFGVFKQEIFSNVNNLVSATLKLYSIVQNKLPPTPSKFHYLFNMRDISRVFQGLCNSTPDHFDSNGRIIRLWRNESLRIFHDRLISDQDKKLVSDQINKIILELFESEFDYATKDPILFGDFRHAIQEENARLYEDLLDFTAVKFIIQEIIEEYNIKNKPMNLVLFDDALEHLIRIHRIIRMNRGHGLLVGVAGSGKQSLTKLASFTAGYSIYEITLSRGYGEVEFKENLKEVYKMIGLDNKKLVFMLTDAQIIQEGFLESINNILTSGYVPALFADDEKDGIISGIRDEAAKFNIQSKEKIWNYFINKCAENLHIVLCMSPNGDLLRTRCRNFPGLVNNTVINWFPPWPQQALFSVAEAFLSVLTDEMIPKEYKKEIVGHMVFVHQSAGTAGQDFYIKYKRSCFMTPKNYLDYINNFFKLLKEKRQENLQLCTRLESGLDKLEESSRQLDDLNEKLAEQNIAV